MNIHDHIKHLKTGYSKVTAHATRETRLGRITKKDAIQIVKFYQSQPISHDDLFYQWLGVKKNSLEFVLRQFTNKKYWLESEPGKLLEKNRSTKKLIKSNSKFKFTANSTLNRGKEHRYITIGKGHP